MFSFEIFLETFSNSIYTLSIFSSVFFPYSTGQIKIDISKRCILLNFSRENFQIFMMVQFFLEDSNTFEKLNNKRRNLIVFIDTSLLLTTHRLGKNFSFAMPGLFSCESHCSYSIFLAYINVWYLLRKMNHNYLNAYFWKNYHKF